VTATFPSLPKIDVARGSHLPRVCIATWEIEGHPVMLVSGLPTPAWPTR